MGDFKSARRVDELGRVVIPKEIRKACKLYGGDVIEVYIEGEKICIEKYSPVRTLGLFAKQFAQTLSQVVDKSVIITDTEKVISTSSTAKEFKDGKLTTDFLDEINNRKSIMRNKTDGANLIDVVEGVKTDRCEFIVPLITDGDIIGSVVVLGNVDNTQIEQGDIVATLFGARLLEKQFENRND